MRIWLSSEKFSYPLFLCFGPFFLETNLPVYGIGWFPVALAFLRSMSSGPLCLLRFVGTVTVRSPDM